LKHAYFFNNGVTIVFKDNRQDSENQKSWLELVAEYLVSRGQTPEDYTLHLPDGKLATFYRVPDGWNWQIDGD